LVCREKFLGIKLTQLLDEPGGSKRELEIRTKFKELDIFYHFSEIRRLRLTCLKYKFCNKEIKAQKQNLILNRSSGSFKLRE
jgi:hypothetical protein